MPRSDPTEDAGSDAIPIFINTVALHTQGTYWHYMWQLPVRCTFKAARVVGFSTDPEESTGERRWRG